jgi:GntR family transcriptional regulator, transcriptional repressor for pyruvate dehydrogenase complex
MVTEFPRLEKRTLVEDFITRFEEMILSGQLSIGEKLPSERELAQKLGVSRPVVHDGLINLAEKGLITRNLSCGSVVTDYRREGSLAMLNSLLNFREGTLEPRLTESTMDFRRLFEVESARLSALNASDQQVEELKQKFGEEENASSSDLDSQAALDFQFHHLIAIASGNILYPLLLNSCRPLYINFVTMFYSIPGIRPAVLQFHRDLIDAIAARDPEDAQKIMIQMLEHGYSGYITSIQP